MFSYISVLHEILKGMSCEEEDDIMEKLEYNLLVIYVPYIMKLLMFVFDKYAYECI